VSKFLERYDELGKRDAKQTPRSGEPARPRRTERAERRCDTKRHARGVADWLWTRFNRTSCRERPRRAGELSCAYRWSHGTCSCDLQWAPTHPFQHPLGPPPSLL